MKYLILFLIACSTVHANEQWQCTEEAASRNDNVWYSCGIGESAMEGAARAQALDSAILEFQKVCALSSDCAPFKRSVEAKRTTCTEAKTGLWKCYRMIQVTLGQKD